MGVVTLQDLSWSYSTSITPSLVQMAIEVIAHKWQVALRQVMYPHSPSAEAAARSPMCPPPITGLENLSPRNLSIGFKGQLPG